MEPQQNIFSTLLIRLRAAGYTVYDGMLPPENVPYPFIYMGESQTVDDARKGAIGGEVYQTIHVWHNNVRERGVLSAMLGAVKTICRQLENESSWLLAECSDQILPDNTTSVPLMHGVVTLGFRF